MAKKALCIGINNHPGTDMDLRGCVNDAEDWAATLAARGFAVQKLNDAQDTKTAKAAAIAALVKSAGSGYSLVITILGARHLCTRQERRRARRPRRSAVPVRHQAGQGAHPS